MNESLEADLPPNLFNQLLINPLARDLEEAQNLQTLKPNPGFCLKTRDAQGNKVFINLCYSDGLPPPKDITEAELEELLSKVETEMVSYRVPLSLGEPKNETDKSGMSCIAYDVVINSDFYKKVATSSMFRNFVIQVAFEGLEDKHHTSLEKQDWTILKNKKYLGTVATITVKTRKEPLISEIESSQIKKSIAAPLIQEVESKAIEKSQATTVPEPKYRIIQHPIVGHPKSLTAEFRLPGVVSAKDIEFDLGEDRIVLRAHPNKFFLDIFIPFFINVDECTAKFEVNDQVLTATMAVLPKP